MKQYKWVTVQNNFPQLYSKVIRLASKCIINPIQIINGSIKDRLEIYHKTWVHDMF